MNRLLPPGLALSGYVQAQYESHQDSQDEFLAGSYLNQDRFLVKRGRVRFDAQWDYAELVIEPDFNTTNGPTATMRRLEATLVFRNKPFDGVVVKHFPRSGPPPVAAPHPRRDGHPVRLRDARQPARALLHGTESGLRGLLPLGGRRRRAPLGRYRLLPISAALVERRAARLRAPRSCPAAIPRRGKDFIARFGVDTNPWEKLRVLAGVSGLRGKGFHAGTDTTKNGLAWTDTNEDSVEQVNEITGVPGTAATPSLTFDRWAVGGDLELMLGTPIGQTMLYGEITVASNLDRGLYPADPTGTGIDVRELGWYAAITQEITRYGVVGFRYDSYDPNADLLDARRGKLIPTSSEITTLSPLVGLILPDRARLVFQYDFVRDSLGRDNRGVPADLANNHWTLRLQVQM